MRILLLLPFFLMLFGCNSEVPSLSPIRKTKIILKTTLPSGVFASSTMIWGKSTNGNGFARSITTSELQKIVLTGDWTFYAIAWTGAELTGDIYCAKMPQPLSGQDQNINLNLTNTGCDATEFRAAANPGGVPNPLGNVQVSFCENVEGINAVTDECSDDLAILNRKEARGHALSFRFSVKTYEKINHSYQLSSETLQSKCLAAGSGSLSGLATLFAEQLPIGDGSTTPFYMELETFPGSISCDQSTHGIKKVTLKHGINSVGSTSKYFADGTVGHKIYVRMTGADICTGENLTTTFAGGTGSTARPYLICNERQFYNMHTIPNASYKLLADIDLSNYYYGKTPLPNIPDNLTCLEKGSNFYPLGFDGSCNVTTERFLGQDFDGGGKTIKGLRILMPSDNRVGLYTYKNGGEIRRLKITDSKIKGAAYVGTLAGSTLARILDITTESSSVEALGPFTGGLVGSSPSVSTCEFKNVRMDKNTVTAGNIATGGIIGESIGCDFSNISVSGYVSSTSITVGGISGILSQGTMTGTSYDGFVRGSAVVGGLTGRHHNSLITNAYVNGVIAATSTTAVSLGGLIGQVIGANSAGNTVSNSYFFGNLQHVCPANTSCLISNLVGDAVPWSTASFTNIFFDQNFALAAFASVNIGSGRPATEFFDTGATWPAVFSKSNHDLPRLTHEVNIQTNDIRHPCRTIPFANESVATQIANGRGTSSQPITLCSFSQLKDMQGNPNHTSKFYQMKSHIVATDAFSASPETFSGQLDGDGKGIIELIVRGNAGEDIAWWNTIASSGVMKNLLFYKIEIDDSSASAATSALIAKNNYGTLTNLYTIYLTHNPGSLGQHGSLVHSNYGTISKSYLSGIANVTNSYSVVAFQNFGVIEDNTISVYAPCFTNVDCFNITGIVAANVGTIRRNEVTFNILDTSLNAFRSNLSFVSIRNFGVIEDIHIKNSRLNGRNSSVHAMTVRNEVSGTIQRIYNEGRVLVNTYSLPSTSPVTFNDYIDGATSIVGFNYGTIDKLKYRYIPRWNYIQQYGLSAANHFDEGAECRYVMGGTLLPTWEPTLTTLYERFGVMVGDEQVPFLLSRPPDFTGPNDVYWANKVTTCTDPVGNVTIHFTPFDILNDAGLITETQRLSWTTFSDWQGARDVTSGQDPVHDYLYSLIIGSPIAKPVWLFDTSNSMRLYR